MLSQDEVSHNSQMLRSSKPLVPATSETGQYFWRDLVIAILFPTNNWLLHYEKYLFFTVGWHSWRAPGLALHVGLGRFR
jgi:hypothetical protein